jgi:hypothetical protein
MHEDRRIKMPSASSPRTLTAFHSSPSSLNTASGSGSTRGGRRRRREKAPPELVPVGSPALLSRSFSLCSFLFLSPRVHSSRQQKDDDSSSTRRRRRWRCHGTPRRYTRAAAAARGAVERYCGGALWELVLVHAARCGFVPARQRNGGAVFFPCGAIRRPAVLTAAEEPG